MVHCRRLAGRVERAQGQFRGTLSRSKLDHRAADSDALDDGVVAESLDLVRGGSTGLRFTQRLRDSTTARSTTMATRSTPSTASRAISILACMMYLGLDFFARLWIVVLWIFTDLLGDAFDGWVIPALGFILVPWTTLTYACVWIIGSDKVSGWEWIPVAIALLVDYVFWAWSRRAFK